MISLLFVLLLLLLPTTTTATATATELLPNTNTTTSTDTKSSTATDEVFLTTCSVSADSVEIDDCGQINRFAFLTARFAIPRVEGKCWYAWQLIDEDRDSRYEFTSFYILDRSNWTLTDQDYLTLVNPNCTEAFCEVTMRSMGFILTAPGRTFQHRFASYYVPEGEEVPPTFRSDPFPFAAQPGELTSGTLTVTDDGDCTYSSHGVDRSWSVVMAVVVVVNIVVAVLTTTT